jgi:hypothetical protein
LVKSIVAHTKRILARGTQQPRFERKSSPISLVLLNGKISMAVAVGRAVPLMGYMNNGKDYSQDGRDVNAYEYIMENHGGPSL